MGGYAYFTGSTVQTPYSSVLSGRGGSANAAVASTYFYCLNIKSRFKSQLFHLGSERLFNS